jgi:hypothetical protein
MACKTLRSILARSRAGGGGDIAPYIGSMGCIVATNPLCQRLNLEANGLINLGGGVAEYIGGIGVSST